MSAGVIASISNVLKLKYFSLILFNSFILAAGDNLVIRNAKPVVPPYVDYQLSELGSSLTPILKSMATWGLKEMLKEN
jgi:hypothetical protein